MLDVITAEALRLSAAQLAKDTEAGRTAAFNLLMPALEAAEHAQYTEGLIALFCRLGDVYFQAGDFETALRAYHDAVHVEGAIGNEQVHFRLGKALFETGDRARAADELARAFMGGGADIFAGADDKYFAFVKTVLKPPVGGW
jgi:tetratricopeptide (TPR) repeat protein